MSAELTMSYPEEMGAMETTSPGEYLAMAKRRKKPMLFSAGIVFALAVLCALFWPPTYRSSATILIEEQEIPQDMVRSTITSYASQQIQVITQQVMTMKNIMAMVEKFKLYPDDQQNRLPEMAVVDAVRDAIELDVISADVIDPRSGRPSEATIAFSLAFENGDPRKAQQVADELVNLYLNENRRNRTEKTESTSGFLRQEAELLDKKLVEIEVQMAEFRRLNKDALPDNYQYNVQNLARLESQLINAQARVRGIRNRETELSAQLAQTSRYAPTVLASGETVLADVDRLKALQSEYRKKAALYNANHPDIKKLKREIDTLSATVGHAGDKEDLRRLLKDRKAELDSLQDKYAPDHPDVVAKKRLIEQLEVQLEMSESGESSAKPDSPSYIYLQTQLSSLRMEKADLQQELATLGKQVNQLNQSLLISPSIETEYAKLQRTHATTQEKLLDLRLKLSEAELAGALEQGLKGQRFTLIEPARLPVKPVSPNRPALVVLGFLLACATGVGMAVMLEALDQSIRSEKALAAVTGSPPLASIPYIKNPKEQDKSRPNWRILILVIVAVAISVIALAAINSFYKPLDVLWYMLLRKLGLG